MGSVVFRWLPAWSLFPLPRPGRAQRARKRGGLGDGGRQPGGEGGQPPAARRAIRGGRGAGGTSGGRPAGRRGDPPRLRARRPARPRLPAGEGAGTGGGRGEPSYQNDGTRRTRTRAEAEGSLPVGVGGRGSKRRRRPLPDRERRRNVVYPVCIISIIVRAWAGTLDNCRLCKSRRRPLSDDSTPSVRASRRGGPGGGAHSVQASRSGSSRAVESKVFVVW